MTFPHPCFALAILVAAAGCLAGPAADPTDAPSIPEGAVIHRANGAGADLTEFPGRVPLLEQRSVAGQPAGEPTVAITPDGTAFYVTIVQPLPTPHIWRSRDLGVSWAEVSPSLAGTPGPGGLLAYPPATNDPFVYSDPLTGRVYDLDFGYTGDCSIIQWSDDGGQTWSRSTVDPCGITRASHDHQSMATGIPRVETTTGYPNVLYYCVNRGEAVCYRSLDGGQTFFPPVATGLRACGGLTGHVVTAPDGTVYLPQVSCSAEAPDEAWVAVSRDDGRTWNARKVVDGQLPLRSRASFTNAHEASIAIDSAGIAYYFFLDGRTLPHLSVSRDHGMTWSHPMEVSKPGLTGANFPSIVAGDAGRIAFLYIGTMSPGGHEATAATTWHAFVGTSLDAASPDPVFATVYVGNPGDPVKRGPCSSRCMTGATVPAGMYDFLDISIDPVTGRIWAALVDLCHGPCASGGPASMDSRAAVGVQVAGTPLRGVSLP